jgi:hypothetical protein
MGCINAQIRRIGGINASVSRVGGINVAVSLVCEINKSTYIKVTPVDAQWIDIDMSATYNILSNTKWEIM